MAAKAYFIRLENKEDLEWLQTILGNSIQTLKGRGSERLASMAENIVRVHDAVINAVPAKEAEALGISAEEFPDDVKPKGRPASNDKYVPNLCPDHPKNEFKRAPRTDCEGCWAAYKRLHPMEYDINRAKFERRQK